MAVKKKAPPIKSETSSRIDPSLTPAAAPKSEPLSGSEKQLENFERAVQFFNKKLFREARDAFSSVIDGPVKEVAHNAKMHVIMCERRLASIPVAPETHEDHYNHAIERLNSHDFDGARKHLDCAMEMVRKDGNTSTDHLYYALALCAGMSGDTEGAFKSLKQAIELNPQNRVAARQDSDLAQIAQQPAIQQLLYPEKAGPS